MKAIMVTFDSLNRRTLKPYGCEWVHTPNFQRLAQRAVTFDNCYVGSMPCMPARRELHTGRYNFLHRSWGPLEPYDDSMPEILKTAGVYTHLVSDHIHYWEDGGATYHSRYNTWQISRGQEGDNWHAEVHYPDTKDLLGRKDQARQQDIINRSYIQNEEDMPQAKTFAMGLEFLETNHEDDNWFLHIETFDPHEPFFASEKYRGLYQDSYDGKEFDWPDYAPVRETEEQVEHVRHEYAALVSMCDDYLGKVLDAMERFSLWKDTLLIVNTDHGYLLGEHEWWAKCSQPFYNEVAHIPLFIWNPRTNISGTRCKELVQTIDIAPTILDYFGLEIPVDMQGISLCRVMEGKAGAHSAILFGLHGCHVNCTDGRYVYMRAPVASDNGPLYNYTLMPSHMKKSFSLEELHSAELSKGFIFTKGCPVLKTNASAWADLDYAGFGTMLFDLEHDPHQLKSIKNEKKEQEMCEKMIALMKECEAPPEQYVRLGVDY